MMDKMSFKKHLPFSLSLLLSGLFVFAGCTTPSRQLASQDCASVDWYELGRRDGASGDAVEKFTDRSLNCKQKELRLFQQLYINGRNAGLSEYCAPENGFALGRSGQTYKPVCPEILEADFLRSFMRGKKAKNLDQANFEIERNLDSLLTKLNSESTLASEKPAIERQIRSLQSLRAKNESEIQKSSQASTSNRDSSRSL